MGWCEDMATRTTDARPAALRLAAVPAHDPVDDLVDGTVAAEDDHEFPVGGGGELTGVTAVLGLFDPDVHQSGQRADGKLADGPAHGGGIRVDNQDAAHLPRLAAA